MTTPRDLLGIAPLFLPADTQAWALHEFAEAAHLAHTYGCTSLLVKVAQGPRFWYERRDASWRDVLSAVRDTGMVALPYIHCFGRYHSGTRSRSLEGECEIMAELMGACGMVVANMHYEWNNKPEWAVEVRTIMDGVPGLFAVTSWGLPSWQKWESVLRALNPCVDCYLPQVDNGHISTRYRRDYGHYHRPVYPVLHVGVEHGPNNIVAIAAESQSACIAFRMNLSAPSVQGMRARLAAYAEPVREIVGMLRARQEEARATTTPVPPLD